MKYIHDILYVIGSMSGLFMVYHMPISTIDGISALTACSVLALVFTTMLIILRMYASEFLRTNGGRFALSRVVHAIIASLGCGVLSVFAEFSFVCMCILLYIVPVTISVYVVALLVFYKVLRPQFVKL